MITTCTRADAIVELRNLYRRAREEGPSWGEDSGQRRPSRVVGSLLAQLAHDEHWLSYAKVVAAFRRVCGDAFAARVQARAAANVRGPMVLRKTSGGSAARAP